MLPATLNTRSLFELAAEQGQQKQPWNRRAVGTAAVLVVLPPEQLVDATVSIRQELVAERNFLAGSIRLWKFFTTLPEGTRLLDF